MSRWSENIDAPRGDDYDQRWEQMAARGESVHGEADLIETLAGEPGAVSILDAGCGTGRVAIELAARGYEVVGVDLDETMLATATEKGRDVEWHRADLTELDLGRTFDLIALPGNVMIFLAPGSEGVVLARLAAHLNPGGRLIAGFQLQPDRLSLTDYDLLAAASGLTLVDRWSTWERDEFRIGGDYAVSLHHRTDAIG